MNKNLRHDQRGITLTELLITLAILGLLTSIIGTFLMGGIRFYRLTTAKGEIQRDVRQSIDLINRSLRQGRADAVTISRFDANQPPCSMIQFTHIDGKDYRFYQQGKRLRVGIRDNASSPWRENTVAENLRTLFFAYPKTDDATIVSVSVCFEKATYQGATKSLQLSVEKIRVMN